MLQVYFFYNRKFKIIVGVDLLMAFSVYALNVDIANVKCIKQQSLRWPRHIGQMSKVTPLRKVFES